LLNTSFASGGNALFINQSYRIYGTGPDSLGLKGTANTSLSVWIKKTATGNEGWWSNYQTGGGMSIYSTARVGTSRTDVSPATTEQGSFIPIYSTSMPLNFWTDFGTDAWIHLAFVDDGSLLHYYVNGEELSMRNNELDPTVQERVFNEQQGSSVLIGESAASRTPTILLDELKFYNQAFDAKGVCEVLMAGVYHPGNSSCPCERFGTSATCSTAPTAPSLSPTPSPSASVSFSVSASASLASAPSVSTSASLSSSSSPVGGGSPLSSASGSASVSVSSSSSPLVPTSSTSASTSSSPALPSVTPSPSPSCAYTESTDSCLATGTSACDCETDGLFLCFDFDDADLADALVNKGSFSGDLEQLGPGSSLPLLDQSFGTGNHALFLISLIESMILVRMKWVSMVRSTHH